MVEQTNIKELKLFKRGKVRDVYEVDKDKLLIIATDRISCFDFVLPTPIPDKGKILTQISLFWFKYLKDIVPNHLIASDINSLPEILKPYKEQLNDRFVIAKRCKIIPFECVVRGYISGSAWKEYKTKSSVCAISLPKGLKESDKLSEPIFTPATKADVGHDENVSYAYMQDKLGKELSAKIRDISINLYEKANAYAESKGIIIADTKFEFGFDQDKLTLIDEIFTPDSSRFWPKKSYSPGASQPSFDKQFVRDYLDSTDWDKESLPPALPEDIVKKTVNKYKEALTSFTNK